MFDPIHQEFKKMDKSETVILYTEIRAGETAKMDGILLLIFGIGVLIFTAVFFNLKVSFDTEFTKYLTLTLFVCSGIGFIIGGIYYLKRHGKYRALTDLIFANGLRTYGVIENILTKRCYRGLFERRGWKYRILYNYIDDKGVEHSGELTFHSIEDQGFYENQLIKIAFSGDHSVIVEDLEVLFKDIESGA